MHSEHCTNPDVRLVVHVLRADVPVDLDILDVTVLSDGNGRPEPQLSNRRLGVRDAPKGEDPLSDP